MASPTGPESGSADVLPTTGRAYEQALERLPETYAYLLRMINASTSPEAICRQLGIELEALEPLLDLAYRKLRRELTDL